MAKKKGPLQGNGGAEQGIAGGSERRTGSSNDGGRAMPGTASFGPFQSGNGEGFSPLCRAVLDRFERGVIVLTPEGCLIDANGPARQLLEAGDGLALKANRLSFSEPRLEAEFGHLLKTCRAGGAARGMAARVQRIGGGQQLRVLVSPMRENPGHGAAFLVFVYAGPAGPQISQALLKELYGLSRAEAEVTVRLFEGLSVEETARVLDLSLNTIRTHLKHVFAKCAVQSQAELLRLLALGPRAY